MLKLKICFWFTYFFYLEIFYIWLMCKIIKMIFLLQDFLQEMLLNLLITRIYFIFLEIKQLLIL